MVGTILEVMTAKHHSKSEAIAHKERHFVSEPLNKKAAPVGYRTITVGRQK